MARRSITHPAFRSRFADFFFFALLSALPAALFAGRLRHGEVPYFMDTLMYFVPLRVQAARLLSQGEWPLWNRCLMGGVPLFENPQAALAYPPHWPFLFTADGFWFTFPLLAHLGLWAALTFWALRRLGLRRPPALFAGALALAGSYGWSRLQFGNFINVLPWWPLWLGAAHAFAAAAGPFWLLAGALAVAFSVLAGAHQPATYGLAGLLLYALVQFALARRRLRWLLFVTLTLSFGLALAAPGWLPQLAFIRETSRAQGLANEKVLAGTLGSWHELAQALTGDWQLVKTAPGEPWSDAESSAAIGLAALALAAVPPRRRAPRSAWLGCWLAALAGILLSLRAVMTPLLGLVPQAGLFHDPRRWLGLSQWMLILAAALGAASLRDYAGARGKALLPALLRLVPAFVLLGAVSGTQWPAAPRYALASAALATLLLLLIFFARYRPARVLFVLLALVAVGLLGQATRVTTDLRTLPLEPLLNPGDRSLIARAGLLANQRFFSLDWQGSSSYEFRRPDLAQWALPNLACLWGLEDLGGYEPAQSERYRAFIAGLHAAEPQRRLYPSHFGLIGEPLAAAALDEGNVHVALFPRWGVPAYFWPQPGGLQTAYPRGLTRNFQVRVLLDSPRPGEPRQFNVRENNNIWRYPLTPPHPLAPADDLAASTVTFSGPRPPSLLADSVLAAAADLPPQFEGPLPWQLSLARPGEVVGVYYWNADLDALWQPLQVGGIATLLRYKGHPRWTSWSPGAGDVVIRACTANQLALDVQVAPPATSTPAQSPGDPSTATLALAAPSALAPPARLIIHDAYWPGWQATVDGKPAPIRAAGLWRALELAPGRHEVEMRYRPEAIPCSLKIAAVAAGALLVLCLAAWLVRLMVVKEPRPLTREAEEA